MPFKNTDGSHSLYLSQFEGNCQSERLRVMWRSWGKEAIDEARSKDKPIFLSIGCSSSHWCHVMDVKSFNSFPVVKLLNDSFVCIKVDRDERPDVAKEYMTFQQIEEDRNIRCLDELKSRKIRYLDERKSKKIIYQTDNERKMKRRKRRCETGNERNSKKMEYLFDILDDMPLNVFLTPDLKPFTGACYYPLSLLVMTLKYYARTWDVQKDTLIEDANVFDFFFDALPKISTSRKLQHCLAENALYLCAEKLVDGKFCELGSAFKFSRPVGIHLMLYFSKTLSRAGEEVKSKEILKAVSFTLQCMAKSGLHDHIGGGFHRIGSCFRSIITPDLLDYNARPPVPHFEKMLYDQGQLASVYLDAFSITKDVFYSRISRGILDFLRRSMKGRDGEFFSAVDAGTESGNGKMMEGTFYQWSICEVERILGPYATIFKCHYDFQPLATGVHDDFEGKHVIVEAESSATLTSKFERPDYTIGKCRKKLYKWRSCQPKPNLDKTVIVSWNGLVISSFARASKILSGGPKGTKFYFPVSGCDPEEYLEVAEKAAQFIWDNLYKEDERWLCHSFWNAPSKVSGFVDDYAFFISGLLDLYEFGGGIKWLKRAIELQDVQDNIFLDSTGGGYYSTPGNTPYIHRVKEYFDGALPSGNSVSAINLMRLNSMFRDFNYKRTAERLLTVFETELKDKPTEVPLMCCAADMLAVGGTMLVVLFHRGPCVELKDWLVAAHASYNPKKTVIHIDVDDNDCRGFWKEKNRHLMFGFHVGHCNMVEAYVFDDNFQKHGPATDPTMLKDLLLSMEKVICRKKWDLAPCKRRKAPPPESAPESIEVPPESSEETSYEVSIHKHPNEKIKSMRRNLEQIKVAGASVVQVTDHVSYFKVLIKCSRDKINQIKDEAYRIIIASGVGQQWASGVGQQ